ncbi:MAG TPA: gamma-glutamyltransferase, partial [Pseudonocardia sp.]
MHEAGTATGARGAAATGHPLATRAALDVLAAGGGAADAAVAAHAVLAVVLPGSCGVGGDALFLVRDPDGTVTAHNGTGASAAAEWRIKAAAELPVGTARADDGGASVTVPGAVAAWWRVLARHGRHPAEAVLAPAVRAADGGVPVFPALAEQLARQRPRLVRGGAGGWTLLDARPGDV